MIRQKFQGTTEIKTRPSGFGLEVEVRRPLPKHPSDLIPSGVPANEGQAVSAIPKRLYPDGEYREVIPAGSIGSVETVDKCLPPPQYVDTVASYPTEQNDVTLHGAPAALRSADKTVGFVDYAAFTPRRAPIPRAAQDELHLPGPSRNAADPRMTDNDSFTLLIDRDKPERCDLFGENRDGVLHNESAHPGFKAVAAKIGHESGIRNPGAVLAASTRRASPAAKKANPRLNRVKG